MNETSHPQLHLEQIAFDSGSQCGGCYFLHTNLLTSSADKNTILKHYKKLIEIKNVFRQPQNHHEVRFDRIRNHVRIDFLAYWIIIHLAREWKLLKQTSEVTRILRLFQTIRLAQLKIGIKKLPPQIPCIPTDLKKFIAKHKLTEIFSSAPDWIYPIVGKKPSCRLPRKNSKNRQQGG